ncbi:hypothetical protein GCM10022209_35340 [Chitinophaga oryziterrae]
MNRVEGYYLLVDNMLYQPDSEAMYRVEGRALYHAGNAESCHADDQEWNHGDGMAENHLVMNQLDDEVRYLLRYLSDLKHLKLD